MFKPAAAAVLAAACLLLASCGGTPARLTQPSQSQVERLAAVRLDAGEAQRILNAYRGSRGLGPVRLDPVLTGMAQRQAEAMVRANALSHDAGGSFSARVRAAGLDTVRAAENLGGGYYSVAEAFDGWKTSSGHNANLLMPEATRFGIALAKDARTQYRAWWVIVLAADPERRRELDAGPLVPAGGTTTFRWGPSP